MPESARVTAGDRPQERVVLASASPRRRDLLAAAGFAFDVDPSRIDESRAEGESPAAYAERVARDKAAEIAARHPDRVILAADTIVVVDAAVMGKPVDAADAIRMLGALAGRAHEVLTAVAAQRGATVHTRLARTTVWMRPIHAAEIETYVATGEPFDKAGAYAIQGGAGRFVDRIDGDLDTVIGLSLAAVRDVLAALGNVHAG